jgi:hypothetical protein
MQRRVPRTSQDDVIQGRFARWYKDDFAFQAWTIAAKFHTWNRWVRIYLRSAVLRLQRWWPSYLGALHVDKLLSRAADRARIRANLFQTQLASLGDWDDQ